jgi:glutathione S-transferase
MLKIWGRVSSVNVQKVVWCADELGLAYERIEAGGKFGVVDTPAFLAMNPNGLVPVIDDEGFVLYESNAIVRYLAARSGVGALWPAEARARADVDRWMEWQSSAYTPRDGPGLPAARPHARRKAFGRDHRGLALEVGQALGDPRRAPRRQALPHRGCIHGRGHRRGLRRAPLAEPAARATMRPHLERWYAELAARPASRKVTSQVPIT